MHDLGKALASPKRILGRIIQRLVYFHFVIVPKYARRRKENEPASDLRLRGDWQSRVTCKDEAKQRAGVGHETRKWASGETSRITLKIPIERRRDGANLRYRLVSSVIICALAFVRESAMRLPWKWLLVSVGGGVLVTALLIAFADRWVVDLPGLV
jgi:hypothetical protein